MKSLALIRKELAWSRHRIATIAVVLFVLPGAFAYGTLFFEHTLPENTPIAVVGGEGVSADETNVVVGALTFFADPVRYDSMTTATEALEREEIYAVVEIPPGLTEEGREVTVDVHVHGSITPYRVPSRALVGILATNLDRLVPSNVDARRHTIGTERTLSEYLLPTFLMVTLMLVAFTYVPYNLARERDVIDRLRTETSVDAVIAAKFVFFLPLVAAIVGFVHAFGGWLGYDLRPLSPALVGIYLLTFVYLAAIGTAVMLLTDFDVTGRVVNVAVFFVLVPLSNLAYPVGFFSPVSRRIARSIPLHYSTIVARSHMLKAVETGTFADWFGWLLAFTLGCLVALKATIELYKRRQ